MTRFERERMLQATLNFAVSTKLLWAKKAFKLLYLLDVSHFQETGRAVTGLQYSAHDMGPCADELSIELWSPKPDFSSLLEVQELQSDGKAEQHLITARPNVAFDPDPFSPRQLRLMSDLIASFKDEPHKNILVDACDNGAWRSARATGKGRPIDLGEALSAADSEREYKLTVASEYDRRAAYLRALA